MNPDTIQTQNAGSEHDSFDKSKWSEQEWELDGYQILGLSKVFEKGSLCSEKLTRCMDWYSFPRSIITGVEGSSGFVPSEREKMAGRLKCLE